MLDFKCVICGIKNCKIHINICPRCEKIIPCKCDEEYCDSLSSWYDSYNIQKENVKDK